MEKGLSCTSRHLYSSRIALLPFFSLLLVQLVTTQEICQDSCSSYSLPVVRFPFAFKSQNGSRTNNRCGYPGFNLLSCNKTDQSQTILNLPHVPVNFTVEFIDYARQVIHIRDPEECLAKHFLRSSFDLSGTPFIAEFYRSFAFLNCSANSSVIPRLRQVDCLSNKNFTVVAVPTPLYETHGLPFELCTVMQRMVPVPVFWSVRSDSYTRLLWGDPDCYNCESRGGTCGFKNQHDFDVGCFDLPTTGLPRSAKYGMIIGIGIPGLLCIIGLLSYLGSRIRAYGRRNEPIGELSAGPQRSVAILTGLDGRTIESFPKTELGESRRLPNPSDNTCPICLSEYQPKDTLRTIPECNHYFHAPCIDEWLKMNGTCPLCRNSPDGSSQATPSTTTSSSSRSTSSPPSSP